MSGLELGTCQVVPICLKEIRTVLGTPRGFITIKPSLFQWVSRFTDVFFRIRNHCQPTEHFKNNVLEKLPQDLLALFVPGRMSISRTPSNSNKFKYLVGVIPVRSWQDMCMVMRVWAAGPKGDLCEKIYLRHR